jgi:hypothetical protein
MADTAAGWPTTIPAKASCKDVGVPSKPRRRGELLIMERTERRPPFDLSVGGVNWQ